MRRFLKGHWKWVILNTAGIGLNAVLQICFLIPQSKRIIDRGIYARDMAYVCRVGVWMLVITLLTAVMSVVVAWASSRAVAGFVFSLRTACFRKAAEMSPQDAARFGESTLLTRIMTDVTTLQTLLLNILRGSTLVPFIILAELFMLARINLTIFWIFTAFFGVTIAFLIFFGNRSRPYFEKTQKSIDRINLLMKEKITGVRAIRAFDNQRFEEQKLEKADRETYLAAVGANRKISFLSPVSLVFMNWAVIVIYIVGSAQLKAGMASISSLIQVFQYLSYAIASLAIIPSLVNLLPQAGVASRRILEVLHDRGSGDAREADRGKSAGVPDGEEGDRAAARGDIVFDDVVFGYEGANAVIDHVSFTARAGQVTAFIGATGSGKTTLMNLMLKLYRPVSGEIRIGGKSLEDWDTDELRRHTAYGTQRPQVFQDTVRNNITVYRDDCTEEQILSACEDAGFAEVLSGLPDGLDTVMALGGTNLSGGQRQRLSIARTLARDADICILDDTFSALDAKTEQKVLEAVRKRCAGRTLIMVAQKVSTIRDADQIIVLDAGRIAAAGKHEELLEHCAQYREIWQTQCYLEAGKEDAHG